MKQSIQEIIDEYKDAPKDKDILLIQLLIRKFDGLSDTELAELCKDEDTLVKKFFRDYVYMKIKGLRYLPDTSLIVDELLKHKKDI